MYRTVQLNNLYTLYNEKHYIKVNTHWTHSPDITHAHVLYSPCNSSVMKWSNLASAILGPFLCGKQLSFLGLIKCVTSSSPYLNTLVRENFLTTVELFTMGCLHLSAWQKVLVKLNEPFPLQFTIFRQHREY